MGQPPCLLARGCQPFPSSVVTTLPQVPSRGNAPFVSIGRRGSPMALWLDPSGTLEARFPPPTVPLLDAGRLPLVPLFKYGSISNSSISEQAHSSSYLQWIACNWILQGHRKVMCLFPLTASRTGERIPSSEDWKIYESELLLLYGPCNAFSGSFTQIRRNDIGVLGQIKCACLL
jgi:hypothetical protein